MSGSECYHYDCIVVVLKGQVACRRVAYSHAISQIPSGVVQIVSACCHAHPNASKADVECCVAQTLDASPTQHKAAQKSQEPPPPRVTEYDASRHTAAIKHLNKEGDEAPANRMTGQRLYEGSITASCRSAVTGAPNRQDSQKRGDPCMRQSQPPFGRMSRAWRNHSSSLPSIHG